MRGVYCVVIATLILLLHQPGPARAQFVNGVEDFNGTAFDPDTWVGSGDLVGTTSDGYLDLTGAGWMGTTTLTVGVGQAISARVMLSASNPSGTVLQFGLTETPTFPSEGDHVYLHLLNSMQGESHFALMMGSNRGAGGTHKVMSSSNVGSWYRLRLHRTSLSSYDYRLSTDSGTTLYSLTESYVGLSASAAVFIGHGPTARFDWIMVPEPGAAASLILGGILMLRRSRQVRWTECSFTLVASP